MTDDAAQEPQRQIDRINAARTHYEVLGLQFNPNEPDVSIEDVEKSFRQLARKLHPDKCKLEGAAVAFQSINLAHETLVDPEKKAMNDNFIRMTNGRFRGDLDSNYSFHNAGEEVDDLFRDKPEGGYCDALMRFALMVGMVVFAWSSARLRVELPAVAKLDRAATPLGMVLAVLLFGWLMDWSWWMIFKWSASLYYGWSAAHIIPWEQVVAWQTQHAQTRLGIPIWAGLAIAFLSRIGLQFDLLSSCYIGICEIFLLGLTCLRHGSLWVMTGVASGFLLVVALADVDGGISACLAVFIFFCGSKDGGVIVYVSLILLILYTAFRITPLLCVALLFACAVRSQDLELTTITTVLIAVISLWCFGFYWLCFLAIEGVICKWSFGLLWPDQGWGHKWVPLVVALFAGLHGMAQVSTLAALVVVLGVLGMGFGLSKLMQYENSSVQQQDYRKQSDEAKREKKDAKRTAKKEAKREQRKNGKKR